MQETAANNCCSTVYVCAYLSLCTCLFECVCEHMWFVCEADSCAAVYECVKVMVLCTADRLTE